MKDTERLWSAKEVSEYLGVPVTTLYQWRYKRYGPTAGRVGRYIRYDPSEVRRWFAEQNSAAEFRPR
jgi:predicted DNA-binding transcriptional regulator AlpA